MHRFTGNFTVIDGLDGVGKGEVINAIVRYLKERGLKTFDLHNFWIEHGAHPDFENEMLAGIPNKQFVSLDEFDVLISSEPTFTGIGKTIREELTANNGRAYSATATAQALALDRLILYRRVILPALKHGKKVVQSRSVSSSIVYQPLQQTEKGETPLTVDDVITLEGNKLALDNAPDLLIIPTITNPEEVISRLASREKQDNSEFENLEFQLRLKPLYEGEKLRKIFTERGTAVAYLDAGISIKETRRQAVEIYKQHV